MLNQMYHLKESQVKVTLEWLQSKFESIDFLTIMKGWWLEGNFRSNPTLSGLRTSKFQKRIQIMATLMFLEGRMHHIFQISGFQSYTKLLHMD